MLSKKLSVIHERDNFAPISQISPTSMKRIKENISTEYSLKQNVFDPTKCSPPNEFMMKLKMRMAIYDTKSYNNDDNLESE
jgi:hypothetical protein